jgi:hypothetical protein
MKNKILITVLAVLSMTSAYGQIKKKSHFPVGSFHQPNVNINGIAVGAFSESERMRTNTNGIKLEVPGAGIFLPLAPRNPMDSFPSDDLSEKINGLSLSATGSICNCLINGVSFGTVGQLITKINGLSGVMGFNMVVEHNGVQIGTFNNAEVMRGLQLGLINSSADDAKGVQLGIITYAKRGRGLQIGLFNTADHFKGIQLGFYNRNQKRRMPFINWNFSD